MLQPSGQLELLTATRRLALGLLARAQITAPPVDAFRVAAALGLVVAVDRRQQARGRLVRPRRRVSGGHRGTILLRPDPRPEREHWTVAHEIGEFSAVRLFKAAGQDPVEAPPRVRESVANALAGALLVPTDWLAEAGPSTAWQLPRLKRRFATASHELICRGMLACSSPVVITVFDQGSLTWRRDNVGGCGVPMSDTERDVWREAHIEGRCSSQSDEFFAVDGWPVHETGWKREILRRELPEFAP